MSRTPFGAIAAVLVALILGFFGYQAVTHLPVQQVPTETTQHVDNNTNTTTHIVTDPAPRPCDPAKDFANTTDRNWVRTPGLYSWTFVQAGQTDGPVIDHFSGNVPNGWYVKVQNFKVFEPSNPVDVRPGDFVVCDIDP